MLQNTTRRRTKCLLKCQQQQQQCDLLTTHKNVDHQASRCTPPNVCLGSNMCIYSNARLYTPGTISLHRKHTTHF
uniref:Uncharacterized protein n=1 Tax=Arundo donax TaxID=35708 RepID=A0A0A9CU43_ARUDO